MLLWRYSRLHVYGHAHQLSWPKAAPLPRLKAGIWGLLGVEFLQSWAGLPRAPFVVEE